MTHIIHQNKHLSFGLGKAAAFRIDSKETHTTIPIEQQDSGSGKSLPGDQITSIRTIL